MWRNLLQSMISKHKVWWMQNWQKVQWPDRYYTIMICESPKFDQKVSLDSTIVVYEMFTMSAFLTASAIGFEGLESVENSDGKNDAKIEGFD